MNIRKLIVAAFVIGVIYIGATRYSDRLIAWMAKNE